ncbi:hypothetical protein BC831DRAFT_547211 [Entophlyctis helioformis]|nr:hypothetical protein BC831DRAFT_547211 [Entophlyctis helioformis]
MSAAASAKNSPSPQKALGGAGDAPPAGGGAMPASFMSDFSSFVRQLASATGDLSQLTCPSFLLNGISLLEYSQYWCDHPDLLWDIANPSHSDPADRLLAVVRWFISTLYGSYRSRYVETKSERKPYNPILGEQFFATWNDSKSTGWGEAKIAVEQVSHHPPVSAFHVQIPSVPVAGKPLITVQGHCGQKTVFATSTIKVTQVGRVRVTVHMPNAKPLTYTIFPLPELQICGLLSGTLFLELIGKTRIVAHEPSLSAGPVAEIEFIPKGWFTGDYFQIKGSLRACPTSDPLYTLSGSWAAKTKAVPAGGKDADAKILFDAETAKAEPRIVKPIEEMSEMESLNVWGEVTIALRGGRYSEASALKTTIEETQRKIRKDRKESGEAWTTELFDFVVPTLEGDLEGTTERDPQHRTRTQSSAPNGGEQDAEDDADASEPRGHWVFKDAPVVKP